MTTSEATVNINTLTLADLNLNGIWKVAESANSSEQILLELVKITEVEKNYNPVIFGAIARNMGATANVVEAIVEKIDWKNRGDAVKALAGNPLTPIDLLETLIVDCTDAAIRVAAVKNPSTPTHVIERVAKWSNGKMLTAVIEKELARRSAF